MKETSLLFEVQDGTKLFVRRWLPEGTVRGLVQIVHGKSEHSGRYVRVAERLCAAGLEVWADDHRGHGRTAGQNGNAKASGGMLGHWYDGDGFSAVVDDLEALSLHMQRERPELPLFLLGHSVGSLLAQAYIERSGSRLAGCVLSGTRGPGGADLAVGLALAKLIALFGGKRRVSPLVIALGDGPYNRAFRPNRSPFDWLSRDEAEVDAYAADPYCGFACSVSFYRDIAAGLISIHRSEAMERIPKKLPVFILAGSSDPFGAMGASPTALVEAYRKQGLEDLEFVLYPEGRHEMFNETNREEVLANLVAWFERRLP